MRDVLVIFDVKQCDGDTDVLVPDVEGLLPDQSLHILLELCVSALAHKRGFDELAGG